MTHPQTEALLHKTWRIGSNAVTSTGWPGVTFDEEGHVLAIDLQNNNLRGTLPTSSGYELINMVLEKLGIAQYFDCITSGIDVKHGKPAPDVFLLAAERINKSPEECVVVEDSENGVNAAVAAGMKSVGYINPTSGKQCLDKANIVIDDFRKIDADVIYKL